MTTAETGPIPANALDERRVDQHLRCDEAEPLVAASGYCDPSVLFSQALGTDAAIAPTSFSAVAGRPARSVDPLVEPRDAPPPESLRS